ncbi:serine/threonine-protein kinase VRK1-like isoform X1 [Centruroides vittatus]|uniref:serine/threonine-protein kinase VRK1-like isoform X1 n=1 Tax=Centruroides vittatus TaxID=120091 RepID=UPI003510CC9B
MRRKEYENFLSVQMPKPIRRGDAQKGKCPRLAANGYKLPQPLPPGEILVDLVKQKWRLGKSIGVGGFGEIYLASDEVNKIVGDDANYVIKVEPHANGPLFVEMHFYHRVGKPELIDNWMKQKKLSFLGMPQFISSGSHEIKGVKYRFMVMERFGEDLQKVLERNNKLFPVKTVFSLGIKIIDILEYIHSFGYIHADVKASNLLLGYGKGNENRVYLVDFGLACKYTSDGKHKEYKEDLRKAHDGTIEFTSRDAHIGAHSRRGDLEILGYNMLQWLCGSLPWEDNLKNLEYVSQSKQNFIAHIPDSVKRCFSPNSTPAGIEEYFHYVAGLKFDEEPNYKYLQDVLKDGIRKAGSRHDGKLVFKSSPQQRSKSPKKLSNSKQVLKSARKQIDQKTSPTNQTELKGTKSKHQNCSSLIQSYKNSCNELMQDNSLENPTPAMLMVMQKKLQQQNTPERSSSSFNNKGRKRPSPDYNQLTETEQILKDKGVLNKTRKTISNRKSFSPEF